MAEVVYRFKDLLHIREQDCSIGWATHSAQLRMLFGFALPAMVVVMSGWAKENCSASFAMSTPCLAQCAAALRAAALTASGSFSQRAAAHS